MPIDVKAIICPQCGSADVRMSSDSQGICNACGTKFTVQQQIDTQNVFNEVHIHTGEESSESEMPAEESPHWVKEITPEVSMDEFIRKTWIKLAEEDAPLEVFNTNLENTRLVKHRVFLASEVVNLSWSASIGYDREESYIAMEKEYEQVPYFDRHSGTTKYRRELVERPVTKTRTVTDWRPANGQLRSSADAIAANDSEESFDKSAFRIQRRFISSDSFIDIDLNKIDNTDDYDMKDSTARSIAAEFLDKHKTNLHRALPGDRYRDLRYQIDSTERTTLELWIVPEYRTKVYYDNRLYTKRAFAFKQPFYIGGAQIPNEDSLRDTIDSVRYKKSKEYEEEVWNKTKVMSFITTGLLALSIITSFILFLTVPEVRVPRIIGFLIATGGAAYNIFHILKTNRQVKERILSELNAWKNDYVDNYTAKVKSVLNGKLKSLGYEPVDELHWKE